MTVRRIVANIQADDLAAAEAFYAELLGLDVVMDLGWIRTYGAEGNAPVQVSVMRDGGSGTDVPDLSIEVDDVESVYERARASGLPVTYELTDEPWGVRRFYVRDPFGKVINVLSHNEP